MDFVSLTTDLSVFGVVEYIGYNGDDQSRLILSMTNINNDVQSVEQITNSINALFVTEFPIVEHFSINQQSLKAVYLQQTNV
jgi:hypothetical protein